MDTQLKFFVYLRKSSVDKKRQAISIPAQESEIMPIVEKESLNVVEVFKESHSAKLRGDRVIFNEMIERLEAGEANGIVLWNINRLSRNAGDTGTIIDLMDRGVLLELKSPGQTFRNNPQDKFLLSLFCSNAKLENDNKAVDVKRGMKKKAGLGWRPSKPPLGYRSVLDGKHGFITIGIDSKRFDLLKMCFMRLLAEETTIEKLYLEVRDDYQLRTPTTGNIVSRSAFYRIFRNPFYAGEFEFPIGSGNWYQGMHQPMISVADFHRLQTRLNRKLLPPMPNESNPLPYKNLFQCGECKMSVTGSLIVKKQQNGNIHKYRYYHCTKKSKIHRCRQKTVRQEVIENRVGEILQDIWLPSEVTDWMIEQAKKRVKSRSLKSHSDLETIQDRVNALEQRMDNLTDMRADKEISSESFLAKKKETSESLEKVLKKQKRISGKGNRYINELESVLDFVSYAKSRFENGDKFTKRSLIKHLGSNLCLQDGKVLIELKSELYAIQRLRKHIEKNSGGLKPISLLNKGNLDHMNSVSPIQLPQWD